MAQPPESTELSEVFQYKDEAGIDQYLIIEPLRRWVEANCTLVQIPIDLLKVEDIFASGKIDPDHVQSYTMQRMPRPIIVCEDFDGIASEIVDGNHTYVAMATAFALAEREGITLPISPRLPGYVISKKQMEQFLLPSELCPKKS